MSLARPTSQMEGRGLGSLVRSQRQLESAFRRCRALHSLSSFRFVDLAPGSRGGRNNIKSALFRLVSTVWLHWCAPRVGCRLQVGCPEAIVGER